MKWFFIVVCLAGCGTSVDPAVFDEPPVSSCRGAAEECPKFRDACGCDRQRGCSFHDSVKGDHHDQCVGEPLACEMLTTERRCGEQVGCFWR